MQFFIQRSTDPDALFVVLDSSGQPVYRVTGDSLSIGSKLYLIHQEKNEVAPDFQRGASYNCQILDLCGRQGTCPRDAEPDRFAPAD